MRRLSLLILVAIILPGTAHAAPVYTFPVKDCAVKFSQAHHDYAATDILAKRGCIFVAPISGVIDEVSRIDRWSGKTNLGVERGGLSVSLIGDDGVRYYGSHLISVAKSIEPGVRVNSGQILGRIGSSGSARGTAPHLHFGISWPTPTQELVWWVRRGQVNPFNYLKAWQRGEDLSPAAEVAARKAKVGEIPPLPKK